MLFKNPFLEDNLIEAKFTFLAVLDCVLGKSFELLALDINFLVFGDYRMIALPTDK